MSIIFREPVLTLDEKIKIMQDFTLAYQQEDHTALREVRCLRVQFPAVMGPIREHDELAGRIGGLPIGFNPQAECMQLGYYLDEEELDRLLSETVREDQRQSLLSLRAFWRENITLKKIKARYDESLLQAVPDKHYVYDRAPAYALYRISGTNLDFGKLLHMGVVGLKEKLHTLAQTNPASHSYYEASEMALDIYRDTCLHYEQLALEQAERAENKRETLLRRLARALHHISEQPASSFMEALQMVLLYWLLSGSFNFGRMDTYMAEYYVRDVDTGKITEAEALDLLCSMWRAMGWREKPYDTRVVIGGEGRKNPEEADRFCMLAIRASMQTHDVTPQLTLRICSSTPQQVMELAYEALGSGTTFPILYSDDVNIPAVMKAFGLPRETAEQYCPYGCGEYVIFHQSLGTPSGLINLLKVLELTLNNGYDLHTGEPQGLHTGYLWEDADFESLWFRYTKQVDELMKQLARQEEIEYIVAGEECSFLFFSMLFDDCLERGLTLLEGGVRYLGGTVESYGNINTADSLTAIKKLIFEEKLLDAHTLMHALENNFEGYPEVHSLLLEAPKYGNDDKEADSMAVRVHEQVCTSAAEKSRETCLHSYLVVVINNNANTVLGKHTAASADGRKAHTFMANANSPFRGADRKGVTAMLNSLVKLRPDLHAGCVQNLKLSSDWFHPSQKMAAALVSAYFASGGSQAMVSVVRREELEDAMRNPEKYPNLLVRVGGFSARFVQLAKPEQQEILMRTLY